MNYRVAVRRLVEQVHRKGDLHFAQDHPVSGPEGAETHRVCQEQLRANGAAETECSIRVEFESGADTLTVGGRVDAVLINAQPCPVPVVIEIKATRADPRRLYAHAGHLHSAQAMIYAWALAKERGWSQVGTRIRYVHPDSGQEFDVDATHDLDALTQFAEATLADYLRWLQELAQWRSQRNDTLQTLPFPHGEFRVGQRTLAAACFRAQRDRKMVLAEAPTGSGKSIATLYPALRGLAAGHGARVVFLSARTTGQEAAHNAVAELTSAGATLRHVTVTAKRKICFQPDSPCDPDVCQYSRGYYDRIGPAVAELLTGPSPLPTAQLEEVARAHVVCPFELSLELAQIADVVVCDYNYVIDPVVRSARVTGDQPRQTVLLVDEAHQIPERARDIFSASIATEALTTVAEMSSTRPLRAAAMNLYLRITGLVAADGVPQAPAELAEQLVLPLTQLAEALEPLVNRAQQGATSDVDLLADGPSLFAGLPAGPGAAIGDPDAPDQGPVCLELYFTLRWWLQLWRWREQLALRCLLEETTTGDGHRLRLVCLDPTRVLQETFARFRSVHGFSGSLPGISPQHVGLAPDAVALRLPSPFDPAHLLAIIVRDIDVTYRSRTAALPALCQLIRTLAESRSGNYLVFLPSYAFVAMLADAFAATLPADEHTRLLVQRADFSAGERDDFLAAFRAATDGSRIGLAVMGGGFAESIDLAGDALIGVMVVGVALAPPSLERDLIRYHGGRLGWQLAYQYPALIRVLQTAGRLIRTASDRGVLCLADGRFAQQEYRSLLPEHWRPRAVDAADVAGEVSRFWSDQAIARTTEPAVGALIG